MATIGLDKLYYSKITEGAGGVETYGAPKELAASISAGLSVDIEGIVLYASDGKLVNKKEFKSGTLSLGVADIGIAVAADLTGATVDENDVLVSRQSDTPKPVAVGFRTRLAGGRYRYYWLYRVTFKTPAVEAETKGDSTTFKTPTIEGAVARRNKVDGRGKHPWKAEYTETGTSDATATAWFSSVYEPSYA